MEGGRSRERRKEARYAGKERDVDDGPGGRYVLGRHHVVGSGNKVLGLLEQPLNLRDGFKDSRSSRDKNKEQQRTSRLSFSLENIETVWPRRKR